MGREGVWDERVSGMDESVCGMRGCVGREGVWNERVCGMRGCETRGCVE